MARSLTLLILLIGLSIFSYIFLPKKNNVCHTFLDYYFPEGNDNCFHDPDIVLETPEMIKKYAGVVETHEVTTEDGYILTMFRIPREKPKGVILMHHSIATYSRIYFFQGNDSLAMTLWRNGFDVWLANQRGTSPSDKHINMTKFDFKYWNFCVDEMARYDLPSELELIRQKTNDSKVIYFGHSLGGSIGLIYASLKSTEAKKYIKHMILLSPASQFKYLRVTGIFLRYFFNMIKIFSDFTQIGSPSVYRHLILPSSRIVVRILPPIQFITALFIWIFCGYTPQETDPTFFSYDMGIYLNGYSFKTMIHFAQLTQDPKMYDYGEEKNLEIYGTQEPPFYPVENISIPTLIISSSSDALISPKDCDETFKRLPPESRHGHWKYSGMNHLDFLVGLHRKEIFVDKLMQFLKNLV